jgi:hypothetical protein
MMLVSPSKNSQSTSVKPAFFPQDFFSLFPSHRFPSLVDMDPKLLKVTETHMTPYFKHMDDNNNGLFACLLAFLVALFGSNPFLSLPLFFLPSKIQV